jgi:hypothetical protein
MPRFSVTIRGLSAGFGAGELAGACVVAFSAQIRLKEVHMNDIASPSIAAASARNAGYLHTAMLFVRRLIAPMLTLFFIAFTFFYAGTALIELLSPIFGQGNIIEGLLKGLNMGIVALAVYELAQIVYEEYEAVEPQDGRVARMRRGVIRFVSVTCTALVLEALIMVIKYSQQDLAGFLYYPVAIIVAASVLLMALGVFTRLSHGTVDTEEPPASAIELP